MLGQQTIAYEPNLVDTFDDRPATVAHLAEIVHVHEDGSVDLHIKANGFDWLNAGKGPISVVQRVSVVNEGTPEMPGRNFCTDPGLDLKDQIALYRKLLVRFNIIPAHAVPSKDSAANPPSPPNGSRSTARGQSKNK